LTLPRILGIDPGLNTTGYAILESAESGPKLLEAGVICSTERREPTDMAGRLKVLYDSVIEVVDQFHPTTLAVEQLYAHYDHPRTAILMGHARGAILLAAAQKGLTVNSFASTQVKKTITGNGRASKDQMQRTMLSEFRLAVMPEPSDVADAMAIALCGFYQQRSVVGGERSAISGQRSAKLGIGIRISAFDQDTDKNPSGRKLNADR
jgi:crossover junction endodeoxyribonuclease RuvC